MKTLSLILICTIVLLLPLAVTGEQDTDKTPDTIHPKLVKKWQSTKELRVPESVCYDRERDILYVANINGEPTDKDGNGFISKMTTDGRIIDAHWVKALNAPKGMGIHDGILYVTDIDRLVAIDIEKAKVTETYGVEGAVFLNDIAVDSAGTVYISDSEANLVHRLFKNEVELFVDLKARGVNGLYMDGADLLIGTYGTVFRANTTTRVCKPFIENTGGIDGLKADGRGNYLISNWSSTISLINPHRDIIELLNTRRDRMNAADIEYIVEKQLLLVPTFFDNRVVAYELKYD